jgi:hypothetical protein
MGVDRIWEARTARFLVYFLEAAFGGVRGSTSTSRAFTTGIAR